MATQTAEQLTEFLALSKAKLGMDLSGKDEMKALKKKTALELAANIGRLQSMRDFNAPAAVVAEIATWTPEPERATNGGNGARKPAAPKVSQAKLDYAASLLIDVWGEDEAADLIADLVKYDGEHISRMIDSLKLLVPITAGQLRFAQDLLVQKYGTEGAAPFLPGLDAMTKAEAKLMLDKTQLLPDYVAPAGERAARKGPEVEADGMYRDPATGDIYKVQVAVHGSGKLYAKVLVKLDEPEIKRGKETHYEFVMARGAIMNIKPEWRLTAEDAAEFGHLYGCCIRCGAVLTDEASIERGIGPDCAKKF